MEKPPKNARVLVTCDIHPEALEMLKQRFSIDCRPGIPKDEIARIAGEYCVLVVRTQTAVDCEVLDAAKNLEYVVSCSVGLDNIDTEECGKRGVKVISSPGSNANAVAEHAILLILACLRNFSLATRKIGKGDWGKGDLMGRELSGKTVGIFGFGGIGRLVAKKLCGFGVRVMAYDPYPVPLGVFRELNAEKVGMEKIISESDIISIHVPLTKETRHLFDSKTLSKMKDGVILINTSRGGVIDEDALEKALASGKVQSVGADVFESEPLPRNSFFLKSDRANVTPHIGALTEESFRNMCVMPVRKLLECYDKEKRT